MVPAYNAAGSIRGALESVLMQSVDDFEVIVSDDGSSDETVAVVRDTFQSAAPSISWRLNTLDRTGPAGARNLGIQQARGQFVAFLDDDDRWAPRKLEECLDALECRDLDLVCHSEFWVDAKGLRRLHVYGDMFDAGVEPLVSLMRNNPFSTSAVVVRKDRLIAAGLFDESLPSAEDFDLWLRLVQLPDFRVGFIDEPLGEYTVREGSESSHIERRHRALSLIGTRYRVPLIRASRFGRLECWAFQARVDLSTGLRYLGSRRFGAGAWLTFKGFGMWPFRLDWVALAMRARLRAFRSSSH